MRPYIEIADMMICLIMYHLSFEYDDNFDFSVL